MGWLSNLIVKIKGDSTHLDGTLKKTKSSVGGWASKIGGFIAAAFSVGILIKFAKKVTELFDVQAKAEQSLLIALKGREDIQKSIIKQASELQKITLFGDEATIEAAARLAMLLGQDEIAIKRLLPLVQDLAQAKFEGNVVTAADMVAKSVGSSTNALSRYGITIEGAVGSSKRLESAIAGLNEQVGGQAQAAALVGLGALTQLKNAWSDLMETIGKAIVQNETFQKLLHTLKTTIEKINEKRTSPFEAMTKEQLMAEKTRLETEKDILELKGQELQAENDALEGLAKYNKEARERRRDIIGIIKELDDLDKQILEIDRHLAYKPPPGSAGDIITREKPFTVPTGQLKIPSAAGAHEELTSIYTAKGKTKGSELLFGDTGIREANIALEREMTKMEEVLTAARDMAMDLGAQVVEALGEALAGGNVKDIGKNLLMGLANFLSQFGKLLITMGLGMEAFVKSLATMNPVLAIAAGAAMLVAAGAIKGLLSGGGKSVATGAAGGGYSAAMASQNIKIIIEGKLVGRDIYWSNRRYANEINQDT